MVQYNKIAQSRLPTAPRGFWLSPSSSFLPPPTHPCSTTSPSPHPAAVCSSGEDPRVICVVHAARRAHQPSGRAPERRAAQPQAPPASPARPPRLRARNIRPRRRLVSRRAAPLAPGSGGKRLRLLPSNVAGRVGRGRYCWISM
jgi:hypothetical protein